MIRSLSFAPGLRTRLSGYGFDGQVIENIASQLAFKIKDFASGTVFAMANSGVGFFFTIEDFKVTDFRLSNPREFDAEGCQER